MHPGWHGATFADRGPQLTRQGLTRIARARMLLAGGPGQYHKGATALDKVQPGRDAELTAERLMLFLCDGFHLC